MKRFMSRLMFYSVTFAIIILLIWFLSMIPKVRWEIVDSNSMITDIPTVHDFVPLGITFEESNDHSLKFIHPFEKAWTCFIAFGIGKTSDGNNTVIFHNALPQLYGKGIVRIHFNDNLYLINLQAPLYFDSGGRIYKYPTVYCYGKFKSIKYVVSVSYYERTRLWIHVIKPLESSNGIKLEIEAKARGAPLWFGKSRGPYTLFGFYTLKKDVDIWSSFWDPGTFKGNLTIPGRGSFRISGSFIFVRSIHMPFRGEDPPLGFPAQGQYVWIQQEDLDLMIGYVPNPAPEIIREFKSYSYGRINFPNRRLTFRFDEFKYFDSGGPKPFEMRIIGKYEKGVVNLTGKPFDYFPKGRWDWKHEGIWWGRGKRASWGRTFSIWTGIITLDGETIKVNAIGISEHHRVEGALPWTQNSQSP
ncbi:hypothetical protein DRO64_07665 [Candidatus Bathyarchaeota archaeon]|nr:MAG: hypothetical protein DRO64_07665 [Candidatus Bathyarchaeota archaeon]